MMTTIHAINLIESHPNIRGGRPCIKGTQLRVTDVVAAHVFRGESPDEIAAGYAVSLAGVYAALAYYYEHKDEIDTDLRNQIATAKALKEQYTSDVK